MWITPEVVEGGFVTGAFAAGGPLAEDEVEWLSSLAVGDGSIEMGRMTLNSWFLSDEGLHQLDEALRSGDYKVSLPEHAALLVVAYLLANDRAAEALDLVADISPWFDRVRFYPALVTASDTSSATVHVQDAGTACRALADIRPSAQVAAMNEALLVWNPLYDRLVELWTATVVDDWPCSTWPPCWTVRRSEWIADYERAVEAHSHCTKHLRRRSNFAILREALYKCVSGSAGLDGREVGRIRVVLRRSDHRRGEPGSARLSKLRERQARDAARPLNSHLANAVQDRLVRFPADEGLADPSEALADVPLGDTSWPVPESIARKVHRTLEAPVDELVDLGVIGSAEVLAEVLPQVTAHVTAASFDDATLRVLYSRMYSAFKRRRSLLLLNYERQVQLAELPWVRVLEQDRRRTLEVQGPARDTMRSAALLTIVGFPQTLIPNPMVQELSALAQQAGVSIPLVEEIAADIFMGSFTTKWADAARFAATELEGTLYARYYSLPSPSAFQVSNDKEPRRWFTRSSRAKVDPRAIAFGELCSARATEAVRGDGSFVARNGAVIEQAQILSTHNLIQLVRTLDLDPLIRRRAAELAATSLDCAVRLQRENHTWQSRLRAIKNSAYAWRQAIFYMSFLGAAQQEEILDSLRASPAEEGGNSSERFRHAVLGLEAVVRGARFDISGRVGEGRRFLGWSVGPHWLSPPRAADR